MYSPVCSLAAPLCVNRGAVLSQCSIELSCILIADWCVPFFTQLKEGEKPRYPTGGYVFLGLISLVRAGCCD